MLESHIERKVTDFARRRGWLSYKWGGPMGRGKPDRLFFRNKCVKLVEFKATGKTPTPLQTIVHDQLKQQGFHVHVIDNVEDGRKLLL